MLPQLLYSPENAGGALGRWGGGAAAGGRGRQPSRCVHEPAVPSCSPLGHAAAHQDPCLGHLVSVREGRCWGGPVSQEGGSPRQEGREKASLGRDLCKGFVMDSRGRPAGGGRMWPFRTERLCFQTSPLESQAPRAAWGGPFRSAPPAPGEWGLSEMSTGQPTGAGRPVSVGKFGRIYRGC